ncbi:amidohydrolase family protein [Ancylomarina sp. YFZ004]
MRKISATYIISNAGTPLKNGILVLNDDDSVSELIDRKGSVKEIQDLEYYSGVLVPGFVDVFTFLSWPDMHTDLINSSDLSELSLGEPADAQIIQKAINHLEAYGTKGAADFFPTMKSHDLKLNSKLSIRDISEMNISKMFPEFPTSVLGRLFCNNISSEKAFCIGTGSLKSHLKLSVFEELKYLQTTIGDLSLEQQIKWACLNGATALGLDHLGSFKVGKKPGVNLITNLDYDHFCLKPDSKLKVII